MDVLLVIILAIIALTLVVFGLTMRRWWPAFCTLRAQRSRLSFECASCGYPRDGLPGGGLICPECGMVLERIDFLSREQGVDRRSRRRSGVGGEKVVDGVDGVADASGRGCERASEERTR